MPALPSRIGARLAHWSKPRELGRLIRWIPRRLSGPRRAWPDFLIVGAQKAGTTSLHSYLLQHPMVLPALKKEVHYFDLNYARGPGWYRAHFPLPAELAGAGQGAGHRALTGEASPYYLFHPHAAGRIAATLPEARIIVLLREPVARAFSHYQHSLRKGEEELPFAAALERERRLLAAETAKMIIDQSFRSLPHQLFSYVGRGLYADQLEPYLRHFRRERLLILRSEDLFTDPQSVYDEVLEFLGLEPSSLKSPRAYNIGRYERAGIPLEAELRAFYEPHNQRLYRLIGRDLGW